MTTRDTRTQSEDWIRTLSWDLPTTLDGLFFVLGVTGSPDYTQRQVLRKLTRLPAYQACPGELKKKIEGVINGGKKNGVLKGLLPIVLKAGGEWDESKHPRGQPENRGEFGPGGGGNETPLHKPVPEPTTPLTQPVLEQPEDYQGGHKAPGAHSGAQMHALDNIVAPDIYDTRVQRRYYGSGGGDPDGEQSDRESFKVINAVRGKPDALVTVYRGVPKETTEIHPTDWVTPSKHYAQWHVDSNLGYNDRNGNWVSEGHVISRQVPAKELWWDADSPNEFGWDPEGTKKLEEEKEKESPLSKPVSPTSQPKPLHTSSVYEAAAALAKGQAVELDQPRMVSSLLHVIKDYVDDARKKGTKAPNFNLCQASVKGTNLFCAESKGIPRVQMPQLSGVPTPGSRADSLPKNAKGEVDLGSSFRDHLIKDLGVKVKDTSVGAKYLRASQNELNGAKVAGMADSLEKGKLPPGAIFVSSDDYVVDGHHRWAANIGVSYSEGDDLPMPVQQVDMKIIPLLNEANKFASGWGIPQAAMTKSWWMSVRKAFGEVVLIPVMLKAGEKSGHPFRGNQYTTGESDSHPSSQSSPPEEWKANDAPQHGIFWHGSPNGEAGMKTARYGIHVGTYRAAKEALESRIGRRADGKDWDGTQEYGKTLLTSSGAGMDVGEGPGKMSHSRYPHPATYHVPIRTADGWRDGPPMTLEEAKASGKPFNSRGATYSDQTPVPMDAKPDLFPVKIVGPMTNTPTTPHEDWKANGYMSAQLKRGRAKNGYYYSNEGEGVTIDPNTPGMAGIHNSISAVVPSATHLQRLDHESEPESDYRGRHEAPGPGEGAPMHDITQGIYPPDVYTHPEWYGHSDDAVDIPSWDAVFRLKDRPWANIRVYRAVPEDVSRKDAFHPGDWVTPSRPYAHEHLTSNLNGKGHIYSQVVHANEVFTEGNGISEWGWYPEDEERKQKRVEAWLAHREEVRRQQGPESLPSIGPKPEYTDESQDFDAYRSVRNAWTSKVRRALSLGQLTSQQAKDLKYYGDGNEVNSQGDLIWQPLPQTLYHTTTNASAVRSQGLKTRDELHQQSGAGLGGGADDTVSFTVDPKTAHDIKNGLLEMRRVARGELTAKELWSQANQGTGASSPWADNIAHFWDRTYKHGDPLPRGLQDLFSGITREHEFGKTEDEFNHDHPDGHWRGDPAMSWIGGDDKPRFSSFTRPATSQEQIENTVQMYKIWSAWREQHGGPSDPLFFTSDTSALVHTSPEDIQVLEFHPKPGAQGFPMGGMKEWRTATGDAVELANRSPKSGESSDIKVTGHWNPDTKQSVLSRIAELQRQFPNARPIHSLGIETTTGVEGHSNTSALGWMKFSSKVARGLPPEASFGTATQSIQGIVDHEFGHFVLESMRQDPGWARDDSPLFDSIARGLDLTTDKVYPWHNSQLFDRLERQLGGAYANKSPDEAFCEAFANGLSDHPSKLGTEILDLAHAYAAPLNIDPSMKL